MKRLYAGLRLCFGVLFLSLTFPIWLPIKLIFYPDYTDSGIY